MLQHFPDTDLFYTRIYCKQGHSQDAKDSNEDCYTCEDGKESAEAQLRFKLLIIVIVEEAIFKRASGKYLFP